MNNLEYSNMVGIKASNMGLALFTTATETVEQSILKIELIGLLENIAKKITEFQKPLLQKKPTLTIVKGDKS